MNQRDSMLYSFKMAGGKMKLRDILIYPWGYEFRARASELRKDGWVVICRKGKKPSENEYEVIPPEKTGQLRFVA